MHALEDGEKRLVITNPEYESIRYSNDWFSLLEVGESPVGVTLNEVTEISLNKWYKLRRWELKALSMRTTSNSVLIVTFGFDPIICAGALMWDRPGGIYIAAQVKVPRHYSDINHAIVAYDSVTKRGGIK